MIKNIIGDNDSTARKIFDGVFQLLIICALVAHALETLHELHQYKGYFHWIEITLVTLFSIEYLLRILAADKKLEFIFSFYGMVDLASILPFFIAGVDLKFLRIVRLIRILKLFRHSVALNRFVTALNEIKKEMVVFAALTFIVLYVASAGIYFFESEAQPEVFKSMFHSLWWAVCTLTTVGYGDIYPITLGGKIFTFFILMMGIGIIAIPSALLASALIKDRKK